MSPAARQGRRLRHRAARPRTGPRSWVRHVAATSNAMDLPPRIFTRDAKGIARGLKQSVMRSTRTRGTKFQSAMSMLNLYVNRAGRKLSATDRRRLERAKGELRKAFGRPAHGRGGRRSAAHPAARRG